MSLFDGGLVFDHIGEPVNKYFYEYVNNFQYSASASIYALSEKLIDCLIKVDEQVLLLAADVGMLFLKNFGFKRYYVRPNIGIQDFTLEKNQYHKPIYLGNCVNIDNYNL